jgi:hypothetical protein
MERERIATERAAQYAPMPKGGSFMAGVSGAVVALLGDTALSSFYGWHLRGHLVVSTLVGVTGFLVGFLGHRRLMLLNQQAWRRELDHINRGEDRDNH